ncbi:MAG: hypothetical protein AAF604_18380 [Acidobacteriota bacterium]
MGWMLLLAASPLAAEVETAPFDWTLGTWEGVRRDAADGSEEAMTLRVEPILGGAGQQRHLEVRLDDRVYRGYSVQLFDHRLGKWVRQYANQVRGRFTRLEGEIEADGRSVWRGAARERTRESRLTSERLGTDRWRRTMAVSDDDGKSWRGLWTDELRRAEGGADSLPAPP